MNPLLDEFNKGNHGAMIGLGGSFDIDRIKRPTLTRNYSWAVPTEKAINLIAELSPIVEIGAGTGYWASLISKAGGKIVAYDKAVVLYDNVYHYDAERYYHEILEGGPERISEHPDHTLMLCWPPYDEPLAEICLREYQGDTLVYVGESRFGCTGTEEFFNLLDGYWSLEQEISIPQFAGIHDALFIYRRSS